MFWRKSKTHVVIFCDGAIGERRRATGVGVVVRNPANEIIGLAKQGLPAMTNNEAEYAALVLGLESVRQYKPQTVQVFMDSEVVVGQMIGRFSVRSTGLKQWHSRACRLVRQYDQVSFTHIPREANMLADALANEALSEAEQRGLAGSEARD